MKRTTLDLPRFGAGIGLARTARLAQGLGLDLRALGRRSIVITGSNGKGSTAALLTALLCAAGDRVGTFTSPHLFAFNERFCVDGEPVSDIALADAERRVAAALAADGLVHPGDQAGEFEAWFLVAMCLFEDAQCTRLVVEAGIGGRYDPTRLLSARLAAIVSVDLEHTALLGTSLREIALDKLDVAATGAEVLVGPSLLPEMASLETVCALSGRTCRAPVSEFHDLRAEDTISGHRVSVQHDSLGPVEFTMGLHGAHQVDNALLALSLARTARAELDAANWSRLVRKAWADLKLAGRLERLPGQPSLLIDVGHTPAAIRAAIQAIDRLVARPDRVLLLGISASKDVDGILTALLPHFDRIVIGRGQGGTDPAALAERAKRIAPAVDILAICDDARSALEAGRSAAAGDTVLVGLGGLFWAGALRAAQLMPDAELPDFS